jgi:hypothetical protein
MVILTESTVYVVPDPDENTYAEDDSELDNPASSIISPEEIDDVGSMTLASLGSPTAFSAIARPPAPLFNTSNPPHVSSARPASIYARRYSVEDFSDNIPPISRFALSSAVRSPLASFK